MMTAKEYEALRNSIPETRPEGERGAAAVAARLKGKARAHELPDGMDDWRMTPGDFVRHAMDAAGWPEPGETVQLQSTASRWPLRAASPSPGTSSWPCPSAATP